MRKQIILYFVILIWGASCTSTEPPCIDKEKINPQAMCTQQYEPVCGCNKITYGNACEAENAGVTSWEEGECLKKGEEL